MPFICISTYCCRVYALSSVVFLCELLAHRLLHECAVTMESNNMSTCPHLIFPFMNSFFLSQLPLSSSLFLTTFFTLFTSHLAPSLSMQPLIYLSIFLILFPS